MTPNLIFFRAWPDNLEQTPPLASSLQTLETCFLLLSMRRYPHTLVTCATAIESAIRAKLGLPSEDKSKLWELLEVIQNHPHNIKALDRSSLKDFCDARNRIVHYGFSPDDDSASVSLLLRTGLPLLGKIYATCFDLFLDWRDVRPGANDFHILSPEEMAKVGLRPDVADAMRLSRELCRKTKDVRGLDCSYCAIPLAHHVRWTVKLNFLGDAEETLLEDSDQSWEAEQQAVSRWTKAFEAKGGGSCVLLNCPICGSYETVVAQVDDDQLNRSELGFKSAVCVKCGLFLPNKPFLTSLVLRDEIASRRAEILKDYGIST